MKELDIRLNDTLYWGEQEWECVEVKKVPCFPYKMRNKKTGTICWFTVFGQSDKNTPPVLSFVRYSIEKSGASFERPKEPLRPLDTSTLQKVRYKDCKSDQWGYGWYLLLNEYAYPNAYIRPHSVLRVDMVVATYNICELYEWTD